MSYNDEMLSNRTSFVSGNKKENGRMAFIVARAHNYQAKSKDFFYALKLMGQAVISTNLIVVQVSKFVNIL